MRFSPTPLPGVLTIEMDAQGDERGFFARAFCEDEFARAGLALRPRQINVSHNARAGTLRGMHYQTAPHQEDKLVQCVRGRVFDVALDLRPHEPTHRQWFGIELAPEIKRMLLIPQGCAHGFLTLADDSDLIYVMGQPFAPQAGRGVRFDDPAFGIRWPAEPRLVSARDRSFPDYRT